MLGLSWLGFGWKEAVSPSCKTFFLLFLLTLGLCLAYEIIPCISRHFGVLDILSTAPCQVDQYTLGVLLVKPGKTLFQNVPSILCRQLDKLCSAHLAPRIVESCRPPLSTCGPTVAPFRHRCLHQTLSPQVSARVSALATVVTVEPDRLVRL